MKFRWGGEGGIGDFFRTIDRGDGPGGGIPVLPEDMTADQQWYDSMAREARGTVPSEPNSSLPITSNPEEEFDDQLGDQELSQDPPS